MFDFDMSPYGAFIWPAWGISAVVLSVISLRAVMAARRWKKALASLQGASNLKEGDR